MTLAVPAADPDAARAFADVLRPDEQIVWAGRPDSRHATRVDARLIGLGIFWTLVSGAGFYGFTTNLLTDEFGGVSTAARLLFLAVAAAPFIVVAVYCLGGHVIVRRRRRDRTAYAVTTTRVLVERPRLLLVGAAHRRELALSDIDRVTTVSHRRDVGAVEIHDGRRIEEPLVMDGVSDAEAVARTMRELAGDGERPRS